MVHQELSPVTERRKHSAFVDTGVVRRLAAGALLVASGGCFWKRPQIMTPIRIDNVLERRTDPQPAIIRFAERTFDEPLRRIDRPDWPGPNPFRAATGAPGPDYWQQRAD